MKQNIKSKISQQVSRSFPEMRGVRPSVKRQGKGKDEQYLLVYQGKAELPGGRSINRIVRVVADERGSILRMSTSR
jgi:hypothetical protein